MLTSMGCPLPKKMADFKPEEFMGPMMAQMKQMSGSKGGAEEMNTEMMQAMFKHVNMSFFL